MWSGLIGAHFRQWQLTGHPVGLGLIVQETVVVLLFLFRRPAAASSRSAFAWLVTLLGTFGMLAVRPAYDPIGGLDGLYIALQLLGAAAAVVSLCTLGRSFGLVAANRGIRTGGLYRIVRHPIYASYLVAAAGYLLENPSIVNLAIVAGAWACQLARIGEEEKFLASDPAYREYRARVRYRLIPLLY